MKNCRLAGANQRHRRSQSPSIADEKDRSAGESVDNQAAFFVASGFASFSKEAIFFDIWFGRVSVRRYNKGFEGHVRQLVDSLPYKEEVRGSSPFVPTRSIIENGESGIENATLS
jgi:hypothetical protein